MKRVLFQKCCFLVMTDVLNLRGILAVQLDFMNTKQMPSNFGNKIDTSANYLRTALKNKLLI